MDKDNNLKNKNEKQQTNYLAIGISFGLCIGAALGLFLFNNLAVGISLGMLFGTAIGLAVDNGKKKKKK
ncbi:MAG: hypothetical protein ACI39F_08285 [Acutalibacteraceae bacterium]